MEPGQGSRLHSLRAVEWKSLTCDFIMMDGYDPLTVKVEKAVSQSASDMDANDR